MVQRKGVKNGVATNNTVRETYLGSKAKQLHGLVFQTLAEEQLEVTMQTSYDTTISWTAPHSLDKKKRWEQYPIPVKDNSEYISQLELRRKRKEKNRTLKKEENEKEKELTHYQKCMVKKMENRKKKKNEEEVEQTTTTSIDEEDQSERIVYKTLGQQYPTHEGLEVLTRYNRIHSTDERYKNRFGRTEVWIPPTKEFVNTHYPLKTKWRCYNTSDRIKLKTEVVELNKLIT
jgi:hypothetical protein